MRYTLIYYLSYYQMNTEINTHLTYNNELIDDMPLLYLNEQKMQSFRQKIIDCDSHIMIDFLNKVKNTINKNENTFQELNGKELLMYMAAKNKHQHPEQNSEIPIEPNQEQNSEMPIEQNANSEQNLNNIDVNKN